MNPLLKITSLTLATVLALSLSGCSNSETSPFDAVKQTCDSFETGKTLDQATISADMNSVPTVELNDDALSSEKIETKVIVNGTGPKFVGNEMVSFEYVGINASTGETFVSTKFDGTDFSTQNLKAGESFDLCHALSGATVGSRIAAIFPAEMAHGGQGIADLNIAATDSLIFVFDIKKIYLPYAVGEAQPAQTGFPNVVLSSDNVPGITVPKSDAPTEFKLAVLKKGSGEKVKQGDLVTLHYSGFLWDGGEPFEASWDSGSPVQFELTQGQLIEGFIKAIDGQTVGSQVIAIIPPDLAYGDTASESIPANSTLIFVLDILGTDPVTQ